MGSVKDYRKNSAANIQQNIALSDYRTYPLVYIHNIFIDYIILFILIIIIILTVEGYFINIIR